MKYIKHILITLMLFTAGCSLLNPEQPEDKTYKGMLEQTMDSITEYMDETDALVEKAQKIIADAKVVNIEVCTEAAEIYADAYVSLSEASAKCNNAMSFMNTKRYMSKALLCMPVAAEDTETFMDLYDRFTIAYADVQDSVEKTRETLSKQ